MLVETAFADNGWQIVEFDQAFNNPVVIIGVPDDNSIERGVARIRNLEPGGFELKFQEWMYLDQVHPAEQIDWMVLESGSYTLEASARDLQMEVGHAHSWYKFCR
ncbi:hypothetical protein [Solemya elarraichensis gill symbiont]|uniref:hypothetical protein n=1 Tax=Solemya elarraichensis gill symbiont TaxID=1918949 RepID=UPI00108309B2|nr:hypothetical protein [Solemya elarraichensis gill symbiont]